MREGRLCKKKKEREREVRLWGKKAQACTKY